MSSTQIKCSMIFQLIKRDNLITVFFILFSIFGIISNTNGQSYTREDSEKVAGLIQMASDSIRSNPNKSLLLSEEAVQISRDVNYVQGIALGLNVAGTASRELGHIKKAITYFQDAIKVSEQNDFKKGEADALNGLSRTYGESGDYQKAIENHTLSLKIQESMHDTAGMAESYNDIATSLTNMQFYDEANKYYFMAIALYKTLHNPLNVAVKYSNIASDYIGEKKYQLAFNYLYQSIRICDSLHDNSNLYSIFYTLGICYDKVGREDSALNYYTKAFNASKQVDNVASEVSILNNIGDIYFNHNRYDDAEKYYKDGFTLASKISSIGAIRHASLNLSYIYAQKNDFKDAYQYHLQASTATDSLMNDEKIKASAELKTAELITKFETSVAEEKNQVLQRENDLQKLRLRQKNSLMAGTAVLAVLLIFFSFILIRQNKLSTRQKSLELEQKQLRAQMKPHFIFNCLNSIQHFMAHNDIINANKYLTEFSTLMRKTLDNSSGSTISLQNEMDYLENYLQLESMRFENTFSYELSCDTDIDTNAVEIPTMIIQTFAENSINHGLQYLKNKAGKLKIDFYKEDKNLVCEIDDNGIGREQSQKLRSPFSKHQSRGMELTQQRLALIGKTNRAHYKLEVIDKVNEQQESDGTKVIIQFPLEI